VSCACSKPRSAASRPREGGWCCDAPCPRRHPRES
jgi:hypothetical protein